MSQNKADGDALHQDLAEAFGQIFACMMKVLLYGDKADEKTVLRSRQLAINELNRFILRLMPSIQTVVADDDMFDDYPGFSRMAGLIKIYTNWSVISIEYAEYVYLSEYCMDVTIERTTDLGDTRLPSKVEEQIESMRYRTRLQYTNGLSDWSVNSAFDHIRDIEDLISALVDEIGFDDSALDDMPTEDVEDDDDQEDEEEDE